MHHPTDRIKHTTAFVTPVVEHWLEREIASMGPPHEGSIRRPIASSANALTTELHLAPSCKDSDRDWQNWGACVGRLVGNFRCVFFLCVCVCALVCGLGVVESLLGGV